jgi:hypothetical protein
MKTHLSAADLTDALDEALDPAQAAHLAACAACRREVDLARAALERARTVDVPEPSPLFWDHLAARVRAAIDEPPPACRWWQRPGFALPGAALFAAAVLVAVFAARVPRPEPGIAPQPAATAVATDHTGSGATDHTDRAATDDTDPAAAERTDAVWGVLAAAASTVELSEARAVGLGVGSGSLDAAVSTLTSRERRELERLIRVEMKRTGA